MLEGIHVLSETIKWTASVGELVLGIILGILAISFIASAWVMFKDKDGFFFGIFSFVAILLTIGTIASISSYANRKPYQQYKATIDESVSLTEFTQRYEIVDVDGKIYTIREKVEK